MNDGRQGSGRTRERERHEWSGDGQGMFVLATALGVYDTTFPLFLR